MFDCVFVTFPCGILGQVWYMNVSIPDLCRLVYLVLDILILAILISIISLYVLFFKKNYSTFTHLQLLRSKDICPLRVNKYIHLKQGNGFINSGPRNIYHERRNIFTNPKSRAHLRFCYEENSDSNKISIATKRKGIPPSIEK